MILFLRKIFHQPCFCTIMYLKLQTNTQKIQIPKNSKSYSKSDTELKIHKILSKYTKKKI